MPKIEEIYAYICEEEPGEEGLIAERIMGTWIPFVGADMERMESLREMAELIAKGSGKKVTLVKFSTRTEMEIIGG